MFLEILIITAGASVIITAWFAFGWLRIKSEKVTPSLRNFSVVVAARNEAKNLPHLLQALATQNYEGKYEVILVLDRCTDDSEKVVTLFKHRFDSLRMITIDQTPNGIAPKKFAVKTGIENALHPWIALTDSDCIPGPKWLENIDRSLGEHHQVAIGLSPAKKVPGFLNLFIRFETFLTAFLYAGSAGWKFPYMAVGRNLAYSKEFFHGAGGFGKHSNRLSGDDDLLINRAIQNTSWVLMDSADSQVITTAPSSFGSWVRQKMRHFSASGVYSFPSKVLLTSWHGVHALFYLSLFIALSGNASIIWCACIWAGRDLAVMILMRLLADRWKVKDGLILFPFLDVLYLFYYLIIGSIGIIRKPTWIRK